ncbi:hypothetical protein V5T82_10845 [Magnetovibrio sp. PR-2]|uniref:hypothetical protein n=1 Tax=Magnetovibrio sp. PR-2 TaxID=3120356 RepID=UPI002FCE368F
MSDSKIKIKMGAIEVEFEGSTEFLKQELLDLVEAVSKLHKETHNGSGLQTVETGNQQQLSDAAKPSDTIVGTTNEIAKKLGVNNGADLIFAAAAKLFFVDGSATFSNDDLRREMNLATSFVNKSMKSNFATNLKNAAKNDRLKEVGTNTYSLPAKVEDEVRVKLV